MIKRQDSQLLSSSRRQTPPPPPEKQSHAKTVGCMSGIFKLISKYQNRKKLITFGKKVEKKAITVNTKRANGGMVKDEEENRNINKNVVPRSPMLSPKLRRPNATEKVAETARKPAAVEEEQPGSAWEKEESLEKKRKKLLEALEKCNEDLEALKMIIKAVKPMEAAAAEPPRLVDSGDGDGGAEEMCMKKCEDDEKNEKVRSELWNNKPYFTNNFKCHINENAEPHSRPQPKTNPERHNRIGARCFSKFVKEPYGIRRKPISNEVWASSAMVRNVEEVCNDIIWGEKREVANIGVMLHNHICKDLLEETINELGYHKMYRFPLHGCKRRLSF